MRQANGVKHSNGANGAEHIFTDTAALSTIAVHGGQKRGSRPGGAAVLPIYQTSTFLQSPDVTEYDKVLYTRCNNNPSQVEAGAAVAALEGAEAGMVAASGMAAISSVLMTFLHSGDHLLLQGVLYGGTYDLVHNLLVQLNIEVTEVDSGDPSAWEAALRPNTKVFYAETICNPLTNIPDLPAVVAFAKAHSLVSVIDNTMASPVLFRPIESGFDVVLESATKYLNGHNDVIAGAYAGSKDLVTKILHYHNHFGGSLDPHAAFLLMRGMQTLPLRVRQQCATALHLARWLEQQPQVERVHYAGLPSHKDHKRCLKLLGGHAGGLFSFDLHGGDQAAASLLASVKLAFVGPSLGGTQTLLSQPARSSHAGMTPEQRKLASIKDSTIRVAVGIEDAADLERDFQQALRSIKS